ncbi:hypothetical protein PY254_02480 [Rhodanobacter sp. AS-Z3]|uniref:hypothetical protein n=1 Tax=Rhodanobacter sp. AS-Z3 TaxID=3031330 RepID=UPI0024792885|nr:hypothetical protein [Rhodanobacter sp. AS-Z3]WEN15564.1 hypothetical protein PY254_02480 [Rhodanobacter sp. AS-Z3]
MRIVKVLAWTLGLLLLVLIASFAWGRLRPPTSAQAQALSLLKPAAPPVAAFNAWATVWLLDYDIPADQIDAVYAQERQHALDWAQRLQNQPPTANYQKEAAQHFPKRPEFTAADRQTLCRRQDRDCLSKVRANLQPLRELLARQSARLSRLRAIPTDAILWDETTSRPDIPFPDFGAYENLQLTAAALDFVDGQHTQALAQVCSNALTVRNLHAHTNSLVGAMVANSWMDSIEPLLAGMLTELPADQPIPADCAAAFAPVTRADVSLCAPMQREYQLVQGGFAIIDPAQSRGRLRVLMHLLVDIDSTRRLIAPVYGWACQPAVIDSMLDDRPLNGAQRPQVRYDAFDEVSNRIGLSLARITQPDSANYMNRNEDYAAGLRAMGWLLANRAAARTPVDWRQQFAQARADLQQGGSRDFQLDPAAARLIVPQLKARPDQPSLILPLTK